MKTDVLITGATGLLGRYLIASCPEDFQIIASSSTDKKNQLVGPPKVVDYLVSDIRDIHNHLESISPNIIIHCASIGSVDYAEKEPEETYKVNVEPVRKMVDYCKNTNTKFIFISSNAVYDGDSGPYAEHHAVYSPVNKYGQFKREAEIITKELEHNQMIIRPILMYGWNAPGQRKNPLTIQVEDIEKGRQTVVVDDKYCNPLFAGDCASVIWKAIQMNKWGEEYNVAGIEGSISRYEFAKMIALVFDAPENSVIPVKSSHFNEIAPRPNNTTFNITKIIKELKYRPNSIYATLETLKENRKLIGGW